jgi:glucose/arabinose dehydrogenase
MGTQLRPMYPNLLFVICLCAASFSAIAAERVPWTTSRVIGSPEKPPKYKLERRFSGLQFTNAVDFAYSRDLKRWLLAEQGGKVYTFDAEGKGLQLAADFLPLQSREGSFFAITFDPDFKSNSFLYVCYAQKSDLPDGSKVSRFKVKMDPEPRIDLASEEVLITWLSGGHNGCCLKFGNDGYLYISTGDGAGPNPPDPMKTGQDVSDLLSSILRIDVHHQENGKKYRVPPDNPFVGREKVRPEIWAYGFRNPWRMGFDRKTGELGSAMSDGNCGNWFTLSSAAEITAGASSRAGNRFCRMTRAARRRFCRRSRIIRTARLPPSPHHRRSGLLWQEVS